MFSNTQKRFFAAARGKGMHEAHEMGGKCHACGGMVDAHGMAYGGEVDGEYRRPDDEEYEPYEGEEPENDDGETSQHESSDDNDEKARRAFIRAVRSR